MNDALQKKIKQAPTDPGCYIYKNNSGDIIYVGKAKNIRKRVAQYFMQRDHDPKTVLLVSKIVDVEFIVTDNEVKALLLEASLIQQHQPKYNIDLKSGVRYAYIKITNERFPRLITTRVVKSGDRVYGPFASGEQRQGLIRLATALFGLRSGKLLTRKSHALKGDAIYVEPGMRRITHDEYVENLKRVELLLKGNTEMLLKQLTTEMNAFAKQEQYEMAKIRRDQVLMLEGFNESQKIQHARSYDQDVINYAILDSKLYIQLFNINKGVISSRKSFNFAFKVEQSAEQLFAEFIVQYYYSEDIPQEIIIPTLLPDQGVIEKYLHSLAKRKVLLTVPKVGEKRALLELVLKNIEITANVGEIGLYDLKTALKLPTVPRVIEGFDISNLGARDVVAAMVYFKDGKPDKSNYRKFKIKTVVGQSDFDSMYEVVFRRYDRLVTEGKPMPDLIMIDGGKPQLTAAIRALRAVGVEVPMIGLAKKNEEIYFPGRAMPLVLPKSHKGLQVLQRVRDEVHRFGLRYQRVRRHKRNFGEKAVLR